MYTSIVTRWIVAFVSSLFITTTVSAQLTPYDAVDPLVGIWVPGNMYPGAAVPYGLTNGSPIHLNDNNDTIMGVSTIVLGGTGCHRGGISAPVVRAEPLWTRPNGTANVVLDAGSEIAHPGYYSHTTHQGEIRHEVVATVHGLIHRIIRTPTETHAQSPWMIVFDLGRGLLPVDSVDIQSTSNQWDVVVRTGGFCSMVYDVTLFAHTRLSTTPTEVHQWQSSLERGLDAGLAYQIPASLDTVEFSIAISFTDAEGARKNYLAEVQSKQFDELTTVVRQDWEPFLSTIDVRGGTDEDYRKFYTALFRSFQYPSVFADVDGRFRNFNDSIVTGASYVRRTFYDLWGVIWTTFPLQAILDRPRFSDVIKTSLDHPREHSYPTNWEYLGHELFIMGGDPYPLWLRDMLQKRFVTEIGDHFSRILVPSTQTTKQRTVQYLYLQHGYVPYDGNREGWVPGSVANTLEYAMADDALADISALVADSQYVRLFQYRSIFHRSLFDAETKCFRPKSQNDVFRENFDIDAREGDNPWEGSGGPGFKEGSARDYRWYPTYDIDWLITRLGGLKAASDSLRSDLARIRWSPHNQPQFMMPYLFTYMPGREQLTHHIVDSTITHSFALTRRGWPGNDDLGSTSSWLIWSMCGLYPAMDGTATYRICRPRFESITMYCYDTLNQKRPITIVRRGSGRFVKTVVIDGVSVGVASITHSQFINADTIEFQLTDISTDTLEDPIRPVELDIFPNPASASVTFETWDPQPGILTIHSVIGAQIFEVPFTTRLTISTMSIPPGVYICSVRAGDRLYRSLLTVEW